jgi:aspartate ammonia-lyase
MQSMGTPPRSARRSRGLAIDLSKIASDLRLMVMGPRTGIDEITLPGRAARVLDHAGKINPSIPEMVNQVCFQVMGCDTTSPSRRARAARAQRHDAGDRA